MCLAAISDEFMDQYVLQIAKKVLDIEIARWQETVERQTQIEEKEE